MDQYRDFAFKKNSRNEQGNFIDHLDNGYKSGNK